MALGLTDFSGTVGGNISGTSDLAPLDQQADMIVEWMPDAKKVGLLYCSAEPTASIRWTRSRSIWSQGRHRDSVRFLRLQRPVFRLPEGR